MFTAALGMTFDQTTLPLGTPPDELLVDEALLLDDAPPLPPPEDEALLDALTLPPPDPPDPPP
jgi:hypothetical protein